MSEASIQSRRRTRRRYVAMLVFVVALIAGWSLFWQYASGRAAALIADWKAREAAAGRVYACGDQSIAGFPFRIEVTCTPVSAEFRNFVPPLDIKLPRILVAAQIYQPTLLISEFQGPVSVADAGKPPEFEANWKLGQSSVSGLPVAPQRISLVFDAPEIDHVANGKREVWLKARHLELHARMAEPSADGKAGIETALRLQQASVPGFLQGLAALSEFGGGLALIAGLLTPLAAFGIACTMVVAVGLAKRVLGWQARRGLDAMCRDAWRWQTTNPEGY